MEARNTTLRWFNHMGLRFLLGFLEKVINFFFFSVIVSLFSFTGDDGKAKQVASDETKEKGWQRIDPI
jgi:hypothetical protein